MNSTPVVYCNRCSKLRADHMHVDQAVCWKINARGLSKDIASRGPRTNQGDA